MYTNGRAVIIRDLAHHNLSHAYTGTLYWITSYAKLDTSFEGWRPDSQVMCSQLLSLGYRLLGITARQATLPGTVSGFDGRYGGSYQSEYGT